MSEKKNIHNKQQQEPRDKKLMNPGDIQGKIDIHDTRERRDGPGGD